MRAQRISNLFSSFQTAAWFWVFCAILVSLAKLSEIGTSLDPALYGAIARTFARDGKWWSLSASPNLFPQFFEHPFLMFWMNGLVFKVFGASDYTSRILGIFFGAGSFYWLYGIGELLMNARYASILCFLTLFSVHFTGRFPSFYLDVPLVFFLLGAFYFLLRALSERLNSSGVSAGICLGLAFLSKGLAALPGVALVVCLTLYRERLRAWRFVPLWLCLGSAVVLIAGFCSLQTAFGEYSFIERYLHITLFQKALAPGERFFPHGFFYKILQTHPVHLLMILAAPFAVWRQRTLIEPFVVGVIASVIFLFSQGSLRSLHLHYFYPLYPVLNLLAAAGIYPWLERYQRYSAEKLAFRIAIFYLVLWHALPLPMRKKGFVDFFQLDAPIRVIKAAGVPYLEAVGIGNFDWIYRDVSLWYWDLDSKMLSSAAEAKGKAVILGRNAESEALLARRGYLFCAGSPRYLLLVSDRGIQRACQEAGMSEKLIR